MLFDQDDRPVAAEDLPPEPTRRGRWVGRWLLVLGLIAFVGLLVLAGVGFWVRGQIDPSGPPGEEIAFEIPKGATTSAIADKLAEADVITSGEVFRWYLRFKGGGPFEAGQYHLRLNSAMGDVVDVLEEGPDLPPAFNLTIPEGLWVEDVAARVDKADTLDGQSFLDLVNSGAVRSLYQPEGVTSMEGLLFPETYRIEDSETEEGVLRRMVDTFDQVTADLGYSDAPAKVGVSPYEAIIVASLIEAEAKVDADRAKIARVIYNRLEQGIPLGIDATFYYALGADRRGTSLRQSDLEIDSPYNTRENVGLVPTPIGMPGEASLRAALEPEAGDWLYYVLANEDGTHFFTSDYDEFINAKNEAQRNGLIP